MAWLPPIIDLTPAGGSSGCVLMLPAGLVVSAPATATPQPATTIFAGDAPDAPTKTVVWSFADVPTAAAALPAWYDDGTPATAATRQLYVQLAQAQAALSVATDTAWNGFHAVVQGTDYPIDPSPQTVLDVTNAIAGLASAPAGTTVDWEIVDGVWLSLTLADLQGIDAAGVAWREQCYGNKKALNTALLAAVAAGTSPLSVSLATGWPA